MEERTAEWGESERVGTGRGRGTGSTETRIAATTDNILICPKQIEFAATEKSVIVVGPKQDPSPFRPARLHCPLESHPGCHTVCVLPSEITTVSCLDNV